jgi:hypothetical protein
MSWEDFGDQFASRRQFSQQRAEMAGGISPCLTGQTMSGAPSIRSLDIIRGIRRPPRQEMPTQNPHHLDAVPYRTDS